VFEPTDCLDSGLQIMLSSSSSLGYTDSLELGLLAVPSVLDNTPSHAVSGLCCDDEDVGREWGLVCLCELYEQTDCLEPGLHIMLASSSSSLELVECTDSLELGLFVVQSLLGNTPSYPVAGLYCDNEDAGREMVDIAEHGRFYENCKMYYILSYVVV